MRGKGVLRESSRCMNFSKKTKAVNGGKVKGRPGKVVLIDLDDDSVVIIDDSAGPSQKKFRASNGKSSVEGVINIDDDDDGDEKVSDVGPGISVEADRDLVSDASSSQTRPMYKTMGGSLHTNMDGCEFAKEKTSSFRFSKCKKTYGTKTKPPARNHYGLGSTFDKDLTDSDSSDCEIVTDLYGKLREQWEKASVKRKHDVRNRHSRSEDQSSASESNNEAKAKNTAEESRKEQCPSSANADCAKENQPEFVVPPPKTTSVSSFVDVDEKSEEKPGSVQEKESVQRSGDFQAGGGSGSGDPHDSDGRQSEKDACNGSPGNQSKEPSPQESCKPAGVTRAEDSSFCNECKYKNVCCCDTYLWNDKEPSPTWASSFGPVEQKVGDKQSTHPTTSSIEEENIDYGKAFVPNFRTFDETKVGCDVPLPDENFGGRPEDIASQRVSAEEKSESSHGKACYEEVRADSDGAAVSNSACDGPSSDQNESSSVGPKSSNGNVECAQEVHVTTPVETCIITDREKFKETEEFKRVIEEEWAARQRELQLQSEEAQRLRKKKKAESMRLNDIERRQKQRVEEVRQTQKKNAEDINLKEKFRGEIRKEINMLEITCIDMASLLRGLGIQVDGGFNPMSHDVNAAYKRALLKFHPDRASRMDIRQQVEAEEKFKLISRMKEKFLTSCC